MNQLLIDRLEQLGLEELREAASSPHPDTMGFAEPGDPRLQAGTRRAGDGWRSYLPAIVLAGRTVRKTLDPLNGQPFKLYLELEQACLYAVRK